MRRARRLLAAGLCAVLALVSACGGRVRDSGDRRGGALFADEQLDSLAESVHLGPAAAYYEQALAGDAEAQRRLGMMYATGDDLPRNLTAAIDWLSRAAEQGDCAAQRELGLLYLGGGGRPYDIESASFWLRRASEHLGDCTS